VVLGGGQDASAVTTTDHRAGKFEAKFYDKVNVTETASLCPTTSRFPSMIKHLDLLSQKHLVRLKLGVFSFGFVVGLR
ncbi:hypothetical protein Tco_0906002, partial [Tanacetum coccineum]